MKAEISTGDLVKSKGDYHSMALVIKSYRKHGSQWCDVMWIDKKWNKWNRRQKNKVLHVPITTLIKVS